MRKPAEPGTLAYEFEKKLTPEELNIELGEEMDQDSIDARWELRYRISFEEQQ